MKLFLVEHERDLVRIKVHAEDLQMVGVLAIEQIVPGVTGARLVEKAVVVGRALEDLWIAEVIGQNLVRAGQVVGQSEGFVAHEGETVVVFLDVKLQGDADLVQVAQTSSNAMRVKASGNPKSSRKAGRNPKQIRVPNWEGCCPESNR